MAAGGKGFVLFARAQPDTPGKLAAHAISYENLEVAAYELLARVAERAGDTETAEVARRIRTQELAMSDRLLAELDRAVDASLQAQQPDDLREQLCKYLADAHAIEAQAIALLEKSQDIAGDPELACTRSTSRRPATSRRACATASSSSAARPRRSRTPGCAPAP
jgi:ferritin-like metal-binding protein YciE